IFLGPDADLRFQLAQLRQMEASGKIENGLKLLPNVEFHYDDVTKIKGTYKATPHNLVHIDVTPQKSIPRWFGLHMKLGNVALEDVMACGVICKSRALHSITTRFCLRSGTPEGFSDAFFPKTMISF